MMIARFNKKYDIIADKFLPNKKELKMLIINVCFKRNHFLSCDDSVLYLINIRGNITHIYNLKNPTDS